MYNIDTKGIFILLKTVYVAFFSVKSDISSILLLATPSEPLDFTVSDVNKRGATLSWSPPKQDGGSMVQGYVVERKTGYSSR